MPRQQYDPGKCHSPHVSTLGPQGDAPPSFSLQKYKPFSSLTAKVPQINSEGHRAHKQQPQHRQRHCLCGVGRHDSRQREIHDVGYWHGQV